MQKYLNFQQLFQVIWLLRTYNKYLQSNEKKTQDHPKVFVDQTTARDIRNYLMMTMCYTNCLCASNVVRITVHDVLEAKKHKEIKHAFFLQMSNIRHHSFMVRK